MNESSKDAVRVLVVEDDGDTAQGLQVALETRGCAVSVVASVAEAEAQIARDRPDVVLLDLGLRDGDNGKRLLERMQRSDDCRPLPVIVLSGIDSANSVDQALAAGAQRYLVKPIEIDTLLQAIERVLPLCAVRS